MRDFFKMALVVCVSFFVALSVVAHPLIMSAPAPGLVALCSNGQIVYYSLETGQPVQTDNEKSEIACPCAGLHAIGSDGAWHLSPFQVSASNPAADFPSHQIHADQPDQVHTARAPPILF